MNTKVIEESIFVKRIVNIVRLSQSIDEMREQLRDYHENDIAQSLEVLN